MFEADGINYGNVRQKRKDMKKIMMILPMCAVLAYCSTTHTTDAEMDTAGANTSVTTEAVGYN
jgi:hypothetical protein